jgi:hypothetical protein
MNNRFLKIVTLIASSSLFIAGCGGDTDSFETPNTGIVTNPGTVSQKNFSLLTADVMPAVIDATTGVFTQTDVELTAYTGDRNNQSLSDAHTIYFVPEYGLVNPPSCVTEEGKCTVTWSAIKRPVAGGPASDGYVTITAYTIGEEGFTDSNGNNVFDDNDAGFEDLEEPYVDADNVWTGSNGFTAGDLIIDVVSTNDPTGVNGVHDIADGFFNGLGCTHSSLCGTATSIAVFDSVTMSIISNVTLSRTIGGTVAGLAGSGLVLQNNGADDLSITANGGYTFTTPVDDGLTYAVTVLTQPTSPGQVCTIANASGTVSANVTNADVTCATNTFTIGGTVTGIPATESLTILNNGGDGLIISADGSFVFSTPIADGSTYNVTVLTNPASATCTISGGTATGTVSNANVTNVTIGCI